MTTPSYGIAVLLKNTTLAQARERVTTLLAAQGFGVLTEIDVAATLQKKLGVTVPDYLILGACNPTLAMRAIELEPHVGLLLPCNVVVRAVPEGVEVAIVAARAMLGVIDNDGLDELAAEAESKLGAVAAALRAG